MKRLWIIALMLLALAAGCTGTEAEPAVSESQSGAVVTVFHSPT